MNRSSFLPGGGETQNIENQSIQDVRSAEEEVITDDYIRSLIPRELAGFDQVNQMMIHFVVKEYFVDLNRDFLFKKECCDSIVLLKSICKKKGVDFEKILFYTIKDFPWHGNWDEGVSFLIKLLNHLEQKTGALPFEYDGKLIEDVSSALLELDNLINQLEEVSREVISKNTSRVKEGIKKALGEEYILILKTSEFFSPWVGRIEKALIEHP